MTTHLSIKDTNCTLPAAAIGLENTGVFEPSAKQEGHQQWVTASQSEKGYKNIYKQFKLHLFSLSGNLFSSECFSIFSPSSDYAMLRGMTKS